MHSETHFNWRDLKVQVFCNCDSGNGAGRLK